MKKAKIMLAAIAVIGVIGGAAAFKAKNGSQTVYTYNATNKDCEYLDKYDALGVGVTVTIPDATISSSTPDPSVCTTTVLVGQQAD